GAPGVDERAQARFYAGERLGPGHLAPAAVFADQRGAQAVRVLVQIAQQRALGTDETAAEQVMPVPAHAGDAASVQRDLQPARRLAQRAHPVGGFHGSSKRSCEGVSLRLSEQSVTETSQSKPS